MSDLIIRRPDLQSLRQRYAFSLVTFAFWTIWLYLWLPLISFVAWLVGVDLFREHMIVHGGYLAFLDLLGGYLLVIALIALALLGWAGYNLGRFGKKNRRVASAPVVVADIAAHFAVDAALLADAVGAKRVTIRHDDQRRIEKIEMPGFAPADAPH